MNITLNTKRLVLLGLGGGVLGSLLFLTGLVVGSGIEPVQPDRVAHADTAVPASAQQDAPSVTPSFPASAEASDSLAFPAKTSSSREGVSMEEVKNEAPGPDGPSAFLPTREREFVNPEFPMKLAGRENRTGASDASALNLGPKTSERDTYTVQVGAFLKKQNAEQLSGKLKQRGYSPYILTMWDTRKRQWHTVRLGNYNTREVAFHAADDFKKKEKMSAAVRGIGVL